MQCMGLVRKVRCSSIMTITLNHHTLMHLALHTSRCSGETERARLERSKEVPYAACREALLGLADLLVPTDGTDITDGTDEAVYRGVREREVEKARGETEMFLRELHVALPLGIRDVPAEATSRGGVEALFEEHCKHLLSR